MSSLLRSWTVLTANMYCIGKRVLSNHTQMCTIQLNVTEEYSKTSTVDQKIPLKIFLVDVECPIKERKKERKEKETGKKRK